MNDNEIIALYLDGKLDEVDIEGLRRLKALKELGMAVKPDVPDIANEEPGNGNDTYTTTWMSTTDYKQFHDNLDTDVYDNNEISGYLEYTDSDDGCSDAQLRDNWTVDQNFVNDIILGAICQESLFDICRSGWDVKAGKNARIDIKIAGNWNDPQSVSACTCLSCTTQTYQSYPITLSQLGMYGVACTFDEFKVGGSYRRVVLESMQRRWKEYFAGEIYSALIGASPGYTETLNNTLDCNGAITGSCCTNGSDILARVLDLRARMIEAGYHPTHLIVSPSVANFFKYAQTPSSPAWFNSQVGMEKGVLQYISDLKVVEYCGATVCSTATATSLAWMVCKNRSLGFAFGKQPSAEFERDAECNSVKIVMWSYWGCSVLEAGSIGVIVSPNS